MNRDEVDTLMDARIAKGHEETREWTRRHLWWVVLVTLASSAVPAFVAWKHIQSPEGLSPMWLFSVFVPIFVGLILWVVPRDIMDRARRDAAQIELDYVNTKTNALGEVKVTWSDRFRYMSRQAMVSLCMLTLMGLMCTLAGAYMGATSMVLCGLAFTMALLERDEQEAYTRSRVMYREAAAAGADLRGAFTLTTVTTGDLTMEATRADSGQDEDVALDLDEVEVEAEVAQEVEVHSAR